MGGLSILSVGIHVDYHELSREEIKYATENERNERAREYDDVVRHTEVGCGQINEKGRSVNSPIHGIVHRAIASGFIVYENSWRKVPSTLRVRRMFGIAKERLGNFHCKVERASRW